MCEISKQVQRRYLCYRPHFYIRARKVKKNLEEILVESEVFKEILEKKREPSICAEVNITNISS